MKKVTALLRCHIKDTFPQNIKIKFTGTKLLFRLRLREKNCNAKGLDGKKL